MWNCYAFLVDQDSTKRAGGRKAQDSGESSGKVIENVAHVGIADCIYHWHYISQGISIEIDSLDILSNFICWLLVSREHKVWNKKGVLVFV